MKKRYWLYLLIIAVAIPIFLYRDYIPTTRSDWENLYGLVFEREDSSENAQETSPDPLLSKEGMTSSSPYEGEVPESSRAEGLNNENINQPNDGSVGNIANDNQENIQKNDVNNNNLPDQINHPVPFTPQAPFGKWDQLHEEACEEASLAMAHYFLDKREMVFSNEAEKDIQDLTKFAKDVFPDKEDLNVQDLKTVAEKKYGYKNWKIVNNPDAQDIKNILAAGDIIVAPMAGRELGNPFFKQPGPLYHMLVISGYDNKEGIFITQDPGTKRGKNYKYKFNTLLKALHDFPGDKNKINQGPTRILVVLKNS